MAEKKTALEKAQEALAVAERKRDRTKARLEKAEAEAAEAKALLEVQDAEVAYLAQHPVLKANEAPQAAEVPSQDDPLKF